MSLNFVLNHIDRNSKNVFILFPALLLGAGLMAFASVLSETVTEATQYHRESPTGPTYDYRYGWCFFTAGAAFIMSKMAAVFSLSGYLNRFASVDEMVSTQTRTHIPLQRTSSCTSISTIKTKCVIPHIENQAC